MAMGLVLLVQPPLSPFEPPSELSGATEAAFLREIVYPLSYSQSLVCFGQWKNGLNIYLCYRCLWLQ